MESFILKADTMRGLTELALSPVELKKRINEQMSKAASDGEYWCHFRVPALCTEATVKELKENLINSKYRVKVSYINFVFYITILWAPLDKKVMCDGTRWDDLEDYDFK